jgi:hypothetical protein
MGRSLICAMFALLASWHIASAQNKPPEPPKAPEDRRIDPAPVTPDRVRSDAEAGAKKAADSGQSPSPRSRFFYFSWSSMTPVEFEGLGRHILFLISVWTQRPEWLPVQSVYLRADGKEVALQKVSSWNTPVDAGSVTAKMYGPNREDGFYLVPGGAMLRKGEIVLDINANQKGWVLVALPSNVASGDARRFPNLDPAPNAKPDLKALQAFIQRRFTGFPVPASLP